MLTLKKALGSSVGRKFLMALSGFALVGFLVTHLAGNATLFLTDSAPFNSYVQKLYSMGPLLFVAEMGLLGLFLFHILLAIVVTAKNKGARDHAYDSRKSKGGPSKDSFFSRNMIYSGLAILAFLVLHIWQFRFGPGMAEGYVTDLNGEQARDLYRLVIETFQNPLYVGIYSVAMILLGLHLAHGFWSAFQSLGALNPRTTKPLRAIGIGLAIFLAAGFLFIPICIYLRGGAL